MAKPSAPPELVEKVKNGEVTTNKAYQDLLKENQQLRTDRVEAMNQADRERAVPTGPNPNGTRPVLTS